MTGRRRIYIAGGAGVGKTTLLRKLAGSTGFPAFELDALLWTEGGSGERIPEPDRIEIIHNIAIRPIGSPMERTLGGHRNCGERPTSSFSSTPA
jgi:hypothetical protein